VSSEHSSKQQAARGFSLVEVMIAAALLGLIGAGSLSAIQFAQAESGRTRARTVASSDAQTTIDRILNISVAATNAAGLVATQTEADTMLCSLLTASGGPLETTGGGTLSVSSCPTLTVTGVPVSNTSLKREVSIVPITLGTSTGLEVKVRVSGGQLPSPGFVEIVSQIRK
jgi:prepilin-type N-terminal cleavage/methylation domain-containing protein